MVLHTQNEVNQYCTGKRAYPKNISGKLYTNALQVVHKLRETHLLSTMLESGGGGREEGGKTHRERERVNS